MVLFTVQAQGNTVTQVSVVATIPNSQQSWSLYQEKLLFKYLAAGVTL